MKAKQLFKRLTLILCAIFIIYEAWIFSSVALLRWSNPTTTAFMRAYKVEQKRNPSLPRLKFQWVDYDAIARPIKRAIIASEDAKFKQHSGFDWDGIRNAASKNIRRGKIVAGGSTISQQLAKNLFLSNKRTPWRKAQETITTLMLESLLSKRRILEIYLNVIEWGTGIYGIEAASRHYFGKSAHSLTADQAVVLTVYVPRPRRYPGHESSPAFRKKVAVIHGRMNHVSVP